MRRATSESDWTFPADTLSGHIEGFTLKKRHAKALELSSVAPFVLYDLRHTCLTRWAKVMDPFTLKKLAGNTDLNTTMRYVHLNDDDVRKAMEKAVAERKTEHASRLDEAPTQDERLRTFVRRGVPNFVTNAAAIGVRRGITEHNAV